MLVFLLEKILGSLEMSQVCETMRGGQGTHQTHVYMVKTPLWNQEQL